MLQKTPALTAAPRSVFVYGVLCFDSILLALLKRVPNKIPHRVDGYLARTIQLEEFAPFPVLLAAPEQSVDGFILHDLTAPELLVLDRYETGEHNYYDRVTLFTHQGCNIDYYQPTPRLLNDGSLGEPWVPQTHQDSYAKTYIADVISAFFDSNPDLPR
ncbi:MAG: gamma-glutamylcyclotransferase family protein [Motiliproteus sp.]